MSEKITSSLIVWASPVIELPKINIGVIAVDKDNVSYLAYLGYPLNEELCDEPGDPTWYDFTTVGQQYDKTADEFDNPDKPLGFTPMLWTYIPLPNV